MAYKKILFRRDTAANWLSINPILSAGEIGLESDTEKIKLGDGVSDWDELNYFYGYLGSVGYVTSLVQGTGVTISNNSGSGATPTIAIGQSVATSASPTFAQVLVNNLPSADSHVATKAYVDGIASSINWHDFVVYATAAILPGSPTYSNGTSGVGATLTATSNARLIVDGQNASTANRILVKTQADAKQNGIYAVTAQGSVSTPYVLTRATDFDSGSTYGNINAGDAMYVGFGSTNQSQAFLVTSFGTGTNRAHIVGTDDITFTQFSGTATVTAGTGITKTGNTLSIGQDVATSASVSFAGVTAYLNGVAAEAAVLETARLIGGQSFDGSANIAIGTSDITGLTVTSSDLNKLFNIATTSAQLDYLNTASANVQSQLNDKASLYNPIFTNNITATGQGYFNLVGSVTGNVFGNLSGNVTGSVDGSTSGTHTGPVVGNVTGNITGSSGTVTSIGTHAISEMSDVSASVASTGEFLKWDGFEWVPSDLVTGSKASGKFIKWNGSNWVADVIDLNADTDGNFVASINAGTGVSLTNGTAAESGNPTINIGQAIGTTDSPSFANLSLGNAQVNATGLAYSSGTGLATVTAVGHGLAVGARITVTGATQTDYNGTFSIYSVPNSSTFTYQPLVGPGAANASGSYLVYVGGAITLEGSTDDAFETTIVAVNPTSDRIISLPNATTQLVGTDTTDTLTNKTLTSPTITGISPVITLAGDLSGSATFTNLGNATLTATIAADSVALGTDTTGSYVANLVEGTGVTITANSGEGATPTIAIGQAVGTSSSVSFNTITVANLVVTGSQTSTSQANLNVADSVITLNSNVTGSPTLNAGVVVERGTSANVDIRWNETLDRWEATNDGSTYGVIGQGAKMTISDTPPSSPVNGDFWFESDSAITFVYYDSYWIEIGASGIGAIISSTSPSNPANGQIWFRNTTSETFVYYDGNWVNVGGSGSGSNEISSIMGAY